ncbi:pesticidal protein Cry15Aa [Edaphobacter sp. HDX4]
MRAAWMAVVLLCGVAPVVCSAQNAAEAHSPDWLVGPFTRPADAPVISPRPQSTFTDPISGKQVHWEALHTFNPAAIVKDGKIYVLYRAEDDTGAMVIGEHTSRLGLAESDDGLHFKRLPEPVFYPNHDSQQENEVPGGVEDPRIVEGEDGTYVLTYTQWARTRGVYSVGIATSKDLRTWTKHGKAFGSEGKYGGLKYKSAAIVTHRVGDRLMAAKIKGRYWMYWGEIQIRLATSTDLIHWTPVEDASGKPVELLKDRVGKFDSAFPESGPPPLLTTKGIVVIYNAKNAEKAGGDSKLAAGTYSVGEALFSADDPTKLKDRVEEPVFKPEQPYERSGQYAAGTTFAEGLVLFRQKLFLYYGCADSHVGVATAPVPAMLQ